VLREIAHFCIAVPETIALKRSMPQAAFYDLLMRRADDAGLRSRRQALVHGLTGRVLEIGCGTGLMFAHYAPELSVEAVDVDEDALVLARQRTSETAAAIHVHNASVLALPFPGSAFDAIVSGLVLCSVPDVRAVLREIVRVARQGAEVRLIEHVRSPHALSGTLMAMAEPFWVALNGQGCHMARRTQEEIAHAGLEVHDVEPFQVFARGVPAFPMRLIRAYAPR
jgi:ubiquinone/menaquinone biosynthesis C-methylase UbiE